MEVNQLVSVIIPTYKRAPYLNRAIDSVLNQDYNNIEIIVVDDNDPGTKYRKETEELMKKYINDNRVKYIKHNKNKNGAAARNTGIKNSNGEYITFLDDDDVFLEKRIGIIVNELEKDKKNIFFGAYTNVKMIRKRKNIFLNQVSVCKSGNLQKELLLKEFTIGTGSNMFFKRKAIEKINGFDTNFLRHQDWEFLIRFFREFKMLYIDEVLVVKYTDNPINAPNSYLLEGVKELFLKTFSEDINSFDLETRESIYKIHDIELLESYAYELRIKKIIQLMVKSKSRFNINDYLRITSIIFKSIIKKTLLNKK